MPRLSLFDEFHSGMLVPPKLRGAEAAAIKQVLDSKQFQHHLRRAIREVVRHYRALRKVRVRLSR